MTKSNEYENRRNAPDIELLTELPFKAALLTSGIIVELLLGKKRLDAIVEVYRAPQSIQTFADTAVV